MISFIIPTFKEASVLERTLRDLSTLRAYPFEIIISDGGSTDGTLDIARRYTSLITVHDKDRRQSIAEARNVGAKLAQGAFLVFLDADCSIRDMDASFSRALAHFTDPGLVALNIRTRVFPEYETVMDRIVFSYMNTFYYLANNIFHRGQAPGEFQMMRRSAFDRVGGYREDLVADEDVDMFARLSKVGRTHFDRTLTVYQTGRRAHEIGWPRLLWQWFSNWISVILFNRSTSKEWTPIR